MSYIIKNPTVSDRIRELTQRLGQTPRLQVKQVCCRRLDCSVCGGTMYSHGPYVYAYYPVDLVDNRMVWDVDKKGDDKVDKKGRRVRTWVYLGALEPKR